MRYIDYLEKVKGFSDKTIEAYGNIAKKMERHDNDYKKMLMTFPDYSRNTMRLFFSAIISYYKFLNDDRWKEITLPKKEFKHKEFLSYEEYQEMLTIINTKTRMGRMKRVVVRLLFETGVRASELIFIKKKDIKGNEIKIHGKGKRERIVKVSDWLLSELLNYASQKDDYIFEFGYKNLHRKVNNIIERKVTPHMFRRGYAKHCHDKGVSIYDISLSMGHSSIETTSNYIKRTSEDVDIHKIF